MATAPLAAHAQVTQFLPEADTFVGIRTDTQLWFQAKDTREDGSPNQAEIGPSIDFFFKPLVSLRKITEYDPDKTKQRLLVLSAGYRYLPSPGAPAQNRMLLMATSQVPVKGGILLADRNRLEVNFTNGDASWRYRNRILLQRTVAIRSYHPSWYASAEFYYNSRYEKWSSTAVDAGCIFPFGMKVEISPYYEHQNNTNGSRNTQTDAVGLVLSLFFRSQN